MQVTPVDLWLSERRAYMATHSSSVRPSSRRQRAASLPHARRTNIVHVADSPSARIPKFRPRKPAPAPRVYARGVSMHDRARSTNKP